MNLPHTSIIISQPPLQPVDTQYHQFPQFQPPHQHHQIFLYQNTQPIQPSHPDDQDVCAQKLVDKIASLLYHLFHSLAPIPLL